MDETFSQQFTKGDGTEDNSPDAIPNEPVTHAGARPAEEGGRSRRLSTGGKPPEKIETRMVVERVHTQDGIPCYSAWQGTRNYGSQTDWADSRPQWGIQIYDTTAGSDADDSRLERLALKLHTETWDARSAMGRDEPDRIDLYALPLPPGASDEERAEKCKAHYLAEVAARIAPGLRRAMHYIPPAKSYQGYEHAILIIAEPEAAWDKQNAPAGGDGGVDEDDEDVVGEETGAFIKAMWDRSTDWLEEHGYERGSSEVRKSQRLRLRRCAYGNGKGLGEELMDLREGIESFVTNHADPGYEWDPDHPGAEQGYRKVYCQCKEVCVPNSR